MCATRLPFRCSPCIPVYRAKIHRNSQPLENRETPAVLFCQSFQRTETYFASDRGHQIESEILLFSNPENCYVGDITRVFFFLSFFLYFLNNRTQIVFSLFEISLRQKQFVDSNNICFTILQKLHFCAITNKLRIECSFVITTVQLV